MSRHTTRLLSRLFRPSQWSDAAYVWAAAALGAAVVVGVLALVVVAVCFAALAVRVLLA